MYEYKLNWYANSGTGETVAMISTVDRRDFDAAWNAALHSVLRVELGEGGIPMDADTKQLTRDQFRKVIKALEATEAFQTAVPSEVTSVDFRTGKGWTDA